MAMDFQYLLRCPKCQDLSTGLSIKPEGNAVVHTYFHDKKRDCAVTMSRDEFDETLPIEVRAARIVGVVQ